jgi:hypothetical protein
LEISDKSSDRLKNASSLNPKPSAARTRDTEQPIGTKKKTSTNALP